MIILYTWKSFFSLFVLKIRKKVLFKKSCASPVPGDEEGNGLAFPTCALYSGRPGSRNSAPCRILLPPAGRTKRAKN